LFDGCGQLPLMLGTGSGDTPRQDFPAIGYETAQRIYITIAYLGFFTAKLAVLASVE
jgi:hypothetical protein